MGRREKARSLLRHLDPKEVSDAARVEARNREHALPPVSVYRWWARRTEAVTGSLIDAAANELGRRSQLLIADPFSGGGVIPLAALKRGHRIYAQDLNPWAIQGLEAVLCLPTATKFSAAAERLLEGMDSLCHKAYATQFKDGSPAFISHAIRVAVSRCSSCDHYHRLFPHALVTLTSRREKGEGAAILACRHGHLFHGKEGVRVRCPECRDFVEPDERYLPSRVVTCPECEESESLEERASLGWNWELAVVERSDGKRRELDFPTEKERSQARDQLWPAKRSLGEIPNSIETRVLRRHGFRRWSDIYPARQQFIMERLLHDVRLSSLPRSMKNALSIAVIGTAEMAGHVSRWDRFYLKSYESMASHRFNFTTLTVEPNVVGVGQHGRGTLRRRLAAVQRASEWLAANEIDLPVTTRANLGRRLARSFQADATLVMGSSERTLLPEKSVDLILTDPPYHDDVQYHDLSLPFRAWSRLGKVRPRGEAVAIPHSPALKSHKLYRGTLQRIFAELRRALKPDGRLLFSYANREPAAWVNLFAALRSSGFHPLGYTIVHSENEIDFGKRRGRACTLDLILELAPHPVEASALWRPKPLFHNDEERYLLAVGNAFLASTTLVNGWEIELVSELRSQVFVQSRAGWEDQSSTQQITGAH